MVRSIRIQIWTTQKGFEAFEFKFEPFKMDLNGSNPNSSHSKGTILTIRIQIQTIRKAFEAFEWNFVPFEWNFVPFKRDSKELNADSSHSNALNPNLNYLRSLNKDLASVKCFQNTNLSVTDYVLFLYHMIFTSTHGCSQYVHTLRYAIFDAYWYCFKMEWQALVAD